MPNQCVALDTMFLTDRRTTKGENEKGVKYAVVNMIDVATTFHLAYVFELGEGDGIGELDGSGDGAGEVNGDSFEDLTISTS